MFDPRYILSFVLTSTITLSAMAQNAVKNTSVVSMCGGPGEMWSFNLPYQPWVNFVTMDHSKRLMHTNYGFNIPATASITGIQVDFGYSTNNAPANTLRDSLAMVMVNGTMAGLDKSSLSPWYGNSGQVSFGGDGDTWGIQPSPADVNGSGFGFNIRFHSSTMGTILTFSNGAVMTVYYVNAAGIRSSQSAGNDHRLVITGRNLKLENVSGNETQLELFDLMGSKMYRSSLGRDVQEITIPEEVKAGYYLYSIRNGDKNYRGKIYLN